MTDVVVKHVEHPVWRALNPFIGPFNARDKAYRAEQRERITSLKAERAELIAEQRALKAMRSTVKETREEKKAKKASQKATAKLVKQYRKEGILK